MPYDYWQKFSENPQSDFVPFVWEKELSREELFSLFKKAYRSFYLRPGYIFKKILQIKSAKELFTKAKTAFGILRI